MAGRDDVLPTLGCINGNRDGPRTVCRRDAGGYTFSCFDRGCESGLMPRSVCPAHQIKAKLLDARFGQRQANQASPVRGHEIDRIRRRHLRRDDQITLILAVFVVNKDEHPAVARFLDDLLNRNQCRTVVVGEKKHLELAQRFCRGIPVGILKVTQCVGVKPGGPRKAGARHAPFGDESAEFFDQLCAHEGDFSH